MKRNLFIIIKKAHLLMLGVVILFIAGGASAFYYADKLLPATTKPKDTTIFVDVPEHKLYVMKNGEIIKTFPIATGKYETPSPLGDWVIISKSDWGEGFGGRWMGLNVPWGKYGIHGTTQPHSIGGSASHGCIRMFSKDAAALYKLVPYKTYVKIYGGPYGPFGMGFRRLIPGDRGADVYEVQVRLKKLGFLEGNPDGVYGEATKKALFLFQKKNKLPLSNYIDNSVYKKLNIILMD